jgi:tetratricopeptide (TPR) repeat protein
VIAAFVLAAALQAPHAQAKAPAAPPATLIERASDALGKGQRQEAKRLLESAGARGSVRALLQLARLDGEDGDSDGTLRALRAARALAPNSEDVLAALAETSLHVRAPVPAVLTLESLTRLYPSEPKYSYLLGVGLMSAGDMLAAIDALRRANTLAPDQPLTLLALGLAYNNQKLFTDSRPILRRALDLDPDNVETLAALAEAEAGAGDLDAAERDANRAIARAPVNATANLVIGMVRMAQNRYPEARDALITAATADPASPKPEYQLSLVYARLGDDDSSARHLALYQQKLHALAQAAAALHKPAETGK